MTKSMLAIILLFTVATFAMSWSNALLAAASGDLGVSATVLERCRIDFSEGSADYFETCSNVDVKASGTASNVLGELTAVDAAADPYFLDRHPDSRKPAAMEPNTPSGQALTPPAKRKRGAAKVVTIIY